DYPLPGTSAWILGWGRTSEKSQLASSLQNSKINIYYSSTCNRVVYHDRDDWKSLICAGI
ncbi:trypsin-like serine protease, partial [Arthrospira platensis SPKY2]